MVVAAEDRIGAARQAMARNAWVEAVEQFRAADAAGPLTGDQLEAYAEAAEWAYRADLAIDLHRRAFTAYQAAGDKRSAARAALTLTNMHLHRKEHAISQGWARRAEQLLADTPECPEHGRLHWMFSMRASAQGDNTASMHHADRAMEVALATGDRDVLALALLRKARVLTKLARGPEALALVDEAMLSAVAGELSRMTTGVVYCATIDLCNDLFDFTRASEWTEATQRWCERTSIGGFPGICRIHRAEILRLRGNWQDAEREVVRATDELRAFGALNVVAEAHYELGEIRLRMGDLDGAAAAFRQAHEMGREPLPGIALLWLEQGRAQPAASLVTQALAGIAPTDRLRRAKLLPALIETAIAADDLPTAIAAADELDGVARDSPAVALEALATVSRGTLLVAQKQPAAAITQLRKSIQLWTQLDAPYEAARARVVLADALRSQGDREPADLELRAARSAFERLGAAHSLRRSDEIAVAATGTPRKPLAMHNAAVPLSETLEATPANRVQPTSALPQVGDTLDGKLELQRLIGGGGMGMVFEAKNQRTGRQVAVKLLRRDTCSDPAACNRLLQEALACGRIQHPNVVDIYDAGVHGTHPYIVMELLRGESLAARIDRDGPLPIRDAIDIALQALAGLAAAHKAGIVHRDLKPDNLFLAKSPAGTAVKVVDFGISKFADQQSQLAETQTGAIIGTPYYMSPEQATGSKQIDERTDLYAIGAVLFHAICGRPPYLGNNYNALLAAILTTAAPSPRSLRADTPPPIDAAIVRALARDPAARHATADELAAELRASR